MKLNIGFSALEVIVAMLEYRKVCARWVPRMLSEEPKEHRIQVCQELLNQYGVEGDSFLDHIITSDETESKWQSMKWRHVNSPSKKKFKMLPSVGKVMCTVFWDRKEVILLDFLEHGQTINSYRYIATVARMKPRISRQARE
jgi:histone-lysine N-methyltransferase SETMAR